MKVALGRFNGKNWQSDGWWSIGPRTCSALIETALKARYYYLYAADGGAGTWDGTTEFCTSVRNFSIVGRSHCARRGFDRKGFFAIDTLQAADFTQSLSD